MDSLIVLVVEKEEGMRKEPNLVRLRSTELPVWKGAPIKRADQQDQLSLLAEPTESC